MVLERCREYSIPLILGVIISLIWTNVSIESYHHFIHTPIFFNIDFHFLINDIFMVFFFAIAGVEILNSLSRGGALNPIRKAVTPLMATAGGVIGPIFTFFILNYFFGSDEYINGWGICTATDIALAWLLARIVFGKKHPAVSFLLLLAVADDAIGLIIIAVFYSDPTEPVKPLWLLLIVVGMLIAWTLNRKRVKSYVPYIFGAGTIVWIGMYAAHLHPALSLVFIVPFLPKKGVSTELIDMHGVNDAPIHTTLNKFEHQISPLVDYGLIFFGISNAGVELSQISKLTWIVFASLVIGKTIGISLFTCHAVLLKFKLPEGMRAKDVFLTGLIGGLGLTVALFVASEAYSDVSLQGSAKMGALFTIFLFIFVIALGKIMRIKKIDN
ncbi:Na+/H+ antiporter NhaA [Anaerovorax odorimutans]|uniref:Na+/H+ antiporter NhaA n=1 Tax=Anaerovorax odorimutans TaxID=109327 RepID=UPI0003F9F380|nr:Na+/H+ antiporter NhaA [Anaerovorax odorimutans]